MQPFGLIEDVTLHEDTVPPPPPPPSSPPSTSQIYQSNASSLTAGANTAVVSTNQNELANNGNALNIDVNKASVRAPPHEPSAME